MESESSALRDFTVDSRVWLLSGVALIIGIGATFLAVLLLRLIALSTNLFYYHRFSLVFVSPAGSSLGYWMVIVPVMGGLIVGFMARFGSDKIRGHGIPEAIEAILLHRARIDPKIAILKPISAAIAIGSGGPFGAEGPIIMTGGAFGSLIAQWISSHGRGTHYSSGCRSRRRDVSYLRDSSRRHNARGRTLALRVEAAKPGSSGDCERDCRHTAWISPRRRTALSDARNWRCGSDFICHRFSTAGCGCRSYSSRHEPHDVCIRGLL